MECICLEGGEHWRGGERFLQLEPTNWNMDKDKDKLATSGLCNEYSTAMRDRDTNSGANGTRS